MLSRADSLYLVREWAEAAASYERAAALFVAQEPAEPADPFAEAVPPGASAAMALDGLSLSRARLGDYGGADDASRRALGAAGRAGAAWRDVRAPLNPSSPPL